MAPKRPAQTTTKRPSHPPSTVSPNGSPNQATAANTIIRSPMKSPIKRGGPTMITQAQKQALIDNLQLEVTERARKLRAQYALQAQGLRTRLEIRVHRIPAALRKATIGELMERYVKGPSTGNDIQKSPVKILPTASSPSKAALQQPQSPTKMGEKLRKEVAQQQREQGQGKRGVKRKSDAIDASANRENTAAQALNIEIALQQPHKRAKPSATANAPTTTNIASPAKRTIPPSTTHPTTTREVLSPKSNNTRTIPSHTYSPLKPTATSPEKSPSKFGFIYTSPTKTAISTANKPASPIKPSITAPTATSTAKTRTASAKAPTGTRTASKSVTTGKGTRSKAAAAPAPPRIIEAEHGAPSSMDIDTRDAEAEVAPAERESNISTADSSTSAGTTIVKKPATTATNTRTGTVRGTAAGRTASKATGPTVAKANTATARTAGNAKTTAAAAEGRGTGTIPRGTTAAAKKALASRAEAGVAAAAAAGAIVKGGRTLRKRG